MDERPRPREVRGGRDASLPWLVAGVTAVAVVVRGAVWPLSYFVVGPVLGALPFALLSESWGRRGSMIAEGSLAALALTSSTVIAIGAGRNPMRWERRARIFGALVAVETLVYVGSMVFAALALGGPDQLGRLARALSVVAVLNVPVLVLGLSLARPPVGRLLRFAGRGQLR